MNKLIYVYAGLFLAAFVFSVLLTMRVKYKSLKSGFVAHPRIGRYNERTVAMGGGVAIFGTLFVFLIIGFVIVKLFVLRGYPEFLGPTVIEHAQNFANRSMELFVLIGSLIVLHLLGLVDDIKHLGPKFKLFVQFTVAFVAAYFGDIRVEMFIDNIIITSLLSAIWIVVIINAFNFLDNMDGLSAGMALIATGILLAAAMQSSQVFVSGLAVLFIGSLLGFLVFNFPPAKIFMGDAGSLVVGFMVAALTLKTTYYHQDSSGGLYAVFMPLIVMAVPLYDFISVTFLRISQGKSPFVGDTQHFSHRLKKRGLSDVQVAMTLYLATFGCGVSALFLYKADLVEAIVIFVHTIAILTIIAILESTGRGAIEQ